MRKKLGFCAISMLMSCTLLFMSGCGNGSQSSNSEYVVTTTAPLPIPTELHERKYSLPFQADMLNASPGTGIIQPGETSYYQANQTNSILIRRWYDNADASTNLCEDEIDPLTYPDEMQIARNTIEEFYLRFVSANVSSIASNTELHLMEGVDEPDLNPENSSVNNAVWSSEPKDFEVNDPACYVRSLNGTQLHYDNIYFSEDVSAKEAAQYRIPYDGPMRQLYNETGILKQNDSFAKDINVVFTDLCDSDLDNGRLGAMIRDRLNEARAQGNDVSFYCIGVKLPYYGWVAVPDTRDNSSLQRMLLYWKGYADAAEIPADAEEEVYGKADDRSYYILISGPTALAQEYKDNLLANLNAENIGDSDRSFVPTEMFTAPPQELESNSDSILELVMPNNAAASDSAASDDSAASPQVTAATTNGGGASPSFTRLPNSENPVAASAGTETTSDVPAVQEKVGMNGVTENVAALTIEETKALFNNNDTSALTQYIGSVIGAENATQWEKYLCGVAASKYIDLKSAVANPSGTKFQLLLMPSDNASQRIVNASLYQAQFTSDPNDPYNKLCAWMPNAKTSADNLTFLDTEVDLSIAYRTENNVPAFLLEVELANKKQDDAERCMSTEFFKAYSVQNEGDVMNNSYFYAKNLRDMALQILDADDSIVRRKCYVIIVMKETDPTEGTVPTISNAPIG